MNDTMKKIKFTFSENGQCKARIHTNKNQYFKTVKLTFENAVSLGHLLSFTCPVIIYDKENGEVVFCDGEEIQNEDTIEELKAI